MWKISQSSVFLNTDSFVLEFWFTGMLGQDYRISMVCFIQENAYGVRKLRKNVILYFLDELNTQLDWKLKSIMPQVEQIEVETL